MCSKLIDDNNLPQQIGRYQVKFELGRGGMAAVYACFDPQFGRDVAVKVLPHALLHDPTFRTRFIREAQTVATLDHPFIVPVHDFGEDEGQPYIVMRLMTGGSLADRLAKGAAPAFIMERILSRVTVALDVAHQRGIIHRDLKPGNILFDNQGHTFLSDFGIAHIASTAHAKLTNTGSAVGTPGYMSPEQIQGRPVDGRSDIYALGILLFEALTGQKPFAADTPAMVIVKQMTETVPNICDLQPSLPPIYDELIRRLTAPDRENRPAKATDVTKMLQMIILKSNKTTANLKAPPAPPSTEKTTQPLPQIELPEHNPPPILPTLTPLSNPPLPSANEVAIDAAQIEIPTHIDISCPNCAQIIHVDDPEDYLNCPHCQTETHLAGHLCPYCNTYHDEETGFCIQCGASLTRLCQHCNTVNWSGVEHCQNCHQNLDIFENLRTHDRRVVAEKRQERLSQIRQMNEQERESSTRRMASLRGDPEKLRQRAARRRIGSGVVLLIIFVILVTIGYYFYINF